jgi:hypothetical protein
MNHDEATRYFDGLGEWVPDHRPPMAELVSAGQAAERRKGRRTIGLVAAAVVLVGIGGAAFQHAAQGDDERPNSEPTAVAPVAPDGTRFAGMGRVVVAVPDTWGTELTFCGMPTADTVYFPQDVDYDCPTLPGGLNLGVAAVAIASLDSAIGQKASRLATAQGSINGLAVLTMPTTSTCLDTGFCRAAYENVVVVPDERVVLFVPAGRKGTDVLDSVQLLADGYTTVPFVEAGTSSSDAERVLNDASLEAAAEGADASAPILGTNPVAGSVIPLDGTVELLTEPGPSQPTGDDAVEPAPPTYRALLVGTRTSGWVLRVRTFGSSTCPFEMDSVTVVGSVIEAVDQEAKATGGFVCSDDYSPTTAEYEVDVTDVDPFLDAKSVVITTLSGDRLSMDLKFALE